MEVEIGQCIQHFKYVYLALLRHKLRDEQITQSRTLAFPFWPESMYAYMQNGKETSWSKRSSQDYS